MNKRIDIAAFRKSLKLSQFEFCNIVGISQPYLSGIENMKRDIPDKLYKIITEKYKDAIDNFIINENNSGTITPNIGQRISISLPEAGTQKIIKPDGTVEITSLIDKDNEYLNLLKKKDEQIDKLLSIIENLNK